MDLSDVDTPAGFHAVAEFFGLHEPSRLNDRVESGLQAALIHDSYLNENRQQAPNVRQGATRSLEAIGKRWISRVVALRLYKLRAYSRVGEIAQLHAAALTKFDEFILTLDWVATAACYGKAMSATALSTQTRRKIVCRVVGCMVLLELEEHIHTGMSSFYREADSLTNADVDPVTTLIKAVPEVKQSWTISRHGPDHDPVFTAHLRTPGGRSVSAAAGSRKAARKAASQEYLRRYVKTADARLPATPRRNAPTNMPLPPNTARTVARFLDELGLHAKWRPLLTQAFIDGSWSYEHPQVIAKARQQDLQILAFVGLDVFQFEYIRSVAINELRRPSDNNPFLGSQNDETYSALARALNLDRAVLLGVGESKNRDVNRELMANLFQALAAAVYLGLDTPPVLVDRLPESWAENKQALAPDQARDPDLKTLLQEIALAADLNINDDTQPSGPDHDRRFTTTAMLSAASTQHESARYAHSSTVCIALSALPLELTPGFCSPFQPSANRPRSLHSRA